MSNKGKLRGEFVNAISITTFILLLAVLCVAPGLMSKENFNLVFQTSGALVLAVVGYTRTRMSNSLFSTNGVIAISGVFLFCHSIWLVYKQI